MLARIIKWGIASLLLGFIVVGYWHMTLTTNLQENENQWKQMQKELIERKRQQDFACSQVNRVVDSMSLMDNEQAIRSNIEIRLLQDIRRELELTRCELIEIKMALATNNWKTNEIHESRSDVLQ